MEDKKAAEILQKMLEKYSFTEDEKSALLNAIGVLAWTKLIESKRENRRLKKRKADYDK